MHRNNRGLRLVFAVALLASCATQDKPFPATEIPERLGQGIQSAWEKMGKFIDDAGKSNTGPIPEADPTRKVSEQDCTRPITPEAGNLRCK